VTCKKTAALLPSLHHVLSLHEVLPVPLLHDDPRGDGTRGGRGQRGGRQRRDRHGALFARLLGSLWDQTQSAKELAPTQER
jgi:hypothetical protein